MDTSDRPKNALSPWSSSSLMPSSPGPGAWDEPGADPSAASPRPLNARVVLRALRRHWWQILAIWLVGSIGLGALAYTRIKPQYEVYTFIQVEPPARALLAPGSGGSDAFKPYLDTQVLLVSSPDVIQTAIREPGIAALPRVRDSIDIETELRKDLNVSIPQKGTYLIQVKLTDEDASQAAQIVNAVVRSYIDSARDTATEATRGQIKSLQELQVKYDKIVRDKRDELKAMYKEAGENPDGGIAAKAGKDKEAGPMGRARMTLEEVGKLRAELLNVEIARHAAEADVKFHQQEIQARALPETRAATPDGVEAFVSETFLGMPQVVKLKDEIADLEGQMNVAKARIRNHETDPATRRLKQDLAGLKAQYEEMWTRAYPGLKGRALEAATAAPADALSTSRENELRLAQRELVKAQIREKFLRQQLEHVDLEAKNANNEIVDVQFAQEDLKFYADLQSTVNRSLEQLEYDVNNTTKIDQRAPASASRFASSDSRIKLAAAAPVVMFLLATGLFVLIEFRSARVGDPDELSQRVRLGVIGVVPPLPSLGGASRALSVRGQRDEKRRIEEFVQSLDHLRVTLCAHRPGKSPRRCVLITSATGGEGKTTLAAQLAGRCANAGLMTLLIDADLRRPSLGDLLEVPEGPGLVDVLAGEASPESAMVVIGNAGGFHLLPAGTMGQDPSRLLHGERLGELIAQFRETFDIVIIDAPPVLAVPDALLLGRWVDGAVLAVRHDTSRFPLVERANRRLASVGVPVLGAVINGCRTMESAYGSYRYTPYATAESTATGGGGPQDL